MIVGAVDIGTNSMRLLVLDGGTEICREVEVTALGVGVDRTGRFDEDRVVAALGVLERYGVVMDRLGVARRRAVATSATRDAADGDGFIERAARALGVRPEVISGTDEAKLAYLGATASCGHQAPTVVIDIGGGSTEFVYGNGTVTSATSVDIGSVRLTDRLLHSRPASQAELRRARAAVEEAFGALSLSGSPERVIGVAGSFTSLAAIALDLPAYDRDRVNGSILTITAIGDLIERLSMMTIADTAAIPSLDPKRARVILAGAIIARGALAAIGADEIAVSEHDLLDGLALEVLRSL